MSSTREGGEPEDPDSLDRSKLLTELNEETIIDELTDEVASSIVESGGLLLNDEVVDKLASSLIDQIADEFSEITQKPRPLIDVLEEFREEKLDEVDSVSHYEKKLEYIKQYLEAEVSAETTDNLTSEDVERYNKWRKYDSLDREEPLSKNTLADDMYLFREFIEHMAIHRMVPIRFYHVVDIPKVDYKSGEGVDEKKLDPKIAKAALEYLRKYEYADVEHIAMELMCESGPRKNGLRGRDVADFDYEEGILKFEHEEASPLKNDESSEREIRLYGDVPEYIQDYLENQRPDVTDENGQKPLLTKGDGRISKSMLQKIAYKWTRPCAVGLECPHDRDPEDCEAAQKNNSAYKCPSSRAPHHIRTGYITDQKNRGVSADGIDQRCDVSPRVQELHYDHPDDAEERERFEDEFRNADDDPNSGFAHD